MNPIVRALAAATIVAAAASGTAACTSDGEPGADGSAAPTSSQTATTTSSAAVPGPGDSTVEIPAPVADRWNELGGEGGELGRATGPANEVRGGSVTEFERGAIVLTPAGRAFVVQGEILGAYLESGGPEGDLGFPTSDEATTDGGWISTFEGGVITFLDGAAEVRPN